MQEPPFDATVDVFTHVDNPFEWTWFADGIAVDFTGWTAVFDARVTPDDAAPLFTGTVTLGTPAGQNPGFVGLVIPVEQLAGVTASVAHGDLVLTDTLGRPMQFAHLHLRIHAGSSF